MKRKPRPHALSRAPGQRVLIILLLVLVGLVSGMLIGEMAVGGRLQSGGERSASFAQHSANPDALSPEGEGAPPCLGCPDSYGVAARMRAARSDRMDAAYRELGEVDLDASAPADLTYDEEDSDRFADSDPRAPLTNTTVRVDDLLAEAPLAMPPEE